MAEKLNITHHYDDVADVLYIDFGSDEPCFTENVDGLIMIDIGWFSKLPRGVKIMSPKAQKIKHFSFEMIIGQVEKTCQSLMQEQVKRIEKTEPALKIDLGQQLNQAFASIQ
jgi:hypothetical protein